MKLATYVLAEFFHNLAVPQPGSTRRPAQPENYRNFGDTAPTATGSCAGTSAGSRDFGAGEHVVEHGDGRAQMIRREVTIRPAGNYGAATLGAVACSSQNCMPISRNDVVATSRWACASRR
jgi:hypothetical protein